MKTETIESLFTRCGIVTPRHLATIDQDGLLSLNSTTASRQAEVAAGHSVILDGMEFGIEKVPQRDRLRVSVSTPKPHKVSGLKRIHCGYHKCLTMYVRKVIGRLARRSASGEAFRHFYHRADVFYPAIEGYAFASLSGHALELDRFENVLVSRFIRDPRDLLVSGYFYHKRSAEEWCDIIDPVDEDWDIVQGVVPDGIGRDESFAGYLNRVSIEQGLLAEIEFRGRHYASMASWPLNDERVRLYRYEDIMGNEPRVFADLLKFYQLPFLTRLLGRHYASRYSATRKSGKQGHIRNASSGQWVKYFTPAVNQRFNQLYAELLEKYQYQPASRL